MFYRVNEDGNADIFDAEGYKATSIKTPPHKAVYPMGSPLSTNYNHAEGITLTIDDAKKLGIKEE